MKTGNYAEFAGLLADDAIFVDAHGSAGKAEVVRNSSEVTLSAYSIEDVRFVALSDKSGVIIYKVTESGTSHGRTFTGKVHVSALWAERQGKWLCLYSQETAAK